MALIYSFILNIWYTYNEINIFNIHWKKIHSFQEIRWELLRLNTLKIILHPLIYSNDIWLGWESHKVLQQTQTTVRWLSRFHSIQYVQLDSDLYNSIVINCSQTMSIPALGKCSMCSIPTNYLLPHPFHPFESLKCLSMLLAYNFRPRGKLTPSLLPVCRMCSLKMNIQLRKSDLGC